MSPERGTLAFVVGCCLGFLLSGALLGSLDLFMVGACGLVACIVGEVMLDQRRQ